MRSFRVLIVAALAVPLAGAGMSSDPMDVSGAASASPPVLRGSEPRDSVTVRLPGQPRRVQTNPAPPPAVALPQLAVPAPAKIVAASVSIPEATAPKAASPASTIPKRLPKPILPSEFERDSGLFCQRLISQWEQADAYNLFGEPLRSRRAYDEERKENGQIYAYADPTGRYRELELDFAADSGLLRTVFVYPWSMHWEECVKSFGSSVTSTDAAKGRKFYSYLDRRLDVLVDAAGRVISLGLY
jgi:hypothetical protein